MGRKSDPKRGDAFEMYKAHGGDITVREIARKLELKEKTVSAWKNRDDWVKKIHGTIEPKRGTAKTQKTQSRRSQKRQHVIDALIEAGTYSPALNLLIELYLDAWEEYGIDKSEKLRKEQAKYLGQLGLDGKNKELIKKSGRLLAKGQEEEEKEDEPPPENNKLLQFRQRVSR